MTTERDYLMIDGDSHYYEPPDCFTRFMEPSMLRDAITVDDAESGDETISWRGSRLDMIPPGFFVEALKPGALKEMMRAVKKGLTIAEAGVHANLLPEWTSRSARISTMDDQGVEATLLFPTLGISVEHYLRSDVDALYANLHAFNRWLDEDWGFAHQERVFAAPMLSLRDPERAVEELEWVLARGARVACMKPGHAHHRSPAHPMFDPFWARVEEAGLVMAFHIGESGYNEFYSTDFSEAPNPKPHEKSALQWASFYGDRPIMDTFAACIFHNLFGRFPSLQFLSVENGSLWVPYLLASMDKMKGMGRSGPWLGGKVEGRPSDIFREHVSVSPYPEDDLEPLIDLIGPDRVVMGSDFPHPEGASEPAEMAKRAEVLDPDIQRLYLRDNAYNLLHHADS
jgi:predicted TIM-barrel fold metal-dependent hydrolase